MLLLKNAFHQQRFLISFSVIAFLIIAGIALYKGADPRDLSIQLSGLKIIALMLPVFFSILFLTLYSTALIGNIRAGCGLKGVEGRFNRLISPYLRAENLVTGLVGLAALVFINFTVSIGKSLIPYLGQYRWDPLMAAWDKALHFGYYPHELLVPWMGGGVFPALMNFAYLSWFMVVFLCNGYVLFCEGDGIRRRQYLWTFILSWAFLGVVLATILASVGPVYFQEFYPALDNPYGSLIAHLSALHEGGVDLNVMRMGPALLEMVQSDRVLSLNGISAMPSMHVAIAWLVVLYGFSLKGRVGLVAGMAGLMFFALIQAGSVYLSWHYAIDGYVAVILVSLIWWGVGGCLKAAEEKEEKKPRGGLSS